MSKAVLISIRPKWCELIASGQKTIEVRKTKPKMETPFKCYIYETHGDEQVGSDEYTYVKRGNGRGKVVGEFTCDAIFHFFNVCTDPWELLCGSSHANAKHLIKNCARLSEYELHDYARGQFCVGWHISDLVIYDEPKELGEFRSWNTGVVFKDGYPMPTHEVKRPPQSWMYVEELT